MDRRRVVQALATAPLIAACRSEAPSEPRSAVPSVVEEPILGVEPLGFQWKTRDPFLFCVHHDDHYPAGTDRFGPPVEKLSGRKLGNDFDVKDGFRMYHGEVVPGFPQHPHRGFETVTIVRRGLIDHSDSMGAAARYGQGDVQWLTAGSGIVHAEMFPLLDHDRENPLELFQIWLNLPSRDKFVDPHFTMLWSHAIPRRIERDAAGKSTELAIIAGRVESTAAPPPPPPSSWASHTDSDIAIWTLKLAPGARYTLPAAQAGTNRTLYFFRGKSLTAGTREVGGRHALELRADLPLPLQNGPEESELLLLQARPIGEPVVQRGPFVMNDMGQIKQAYADYRATGFGGWPWPRQDPVHGGDSARFARHADGRIERAS
ncbi:MAG TPA: pirin family protein [Polyangiaceae bacterium]